MSGNRKLDGNNILFKGFQYISDYGIKVFIVQCIRAWGYRALNMKSESLSLRFRDSELFIDSHFNNPQLNREQFLGKDIYVLSDRNITSSIIKYAKMIRSVDHLSSEQIANSVFLYLFPMRFGCIARNKKNKK